MHKTILNLLHSCICGPPPPARYSRKYHPSCLPTQSLTNTHPAMPQSVCTTHWSKKTQIQDVTQPWPGPKRGHVSSVVRATLQGTVPFRCHPGSITALLNMDCSVRLRSPCSWRPPSNSYAGLTGTGSRLPVGRWKVIDNFSILGNICSFSSTKLRWAQAEDEAKDPEDLLGGDGCPAETGSPCRLLASACLSVRQPARQTAWRMRADERPIRQVIARVFFKS